MYTWLNKDSLSSNNSINSCKIKGKSAIHTVIQCLASLSFLKSNLKLQEDLVIRTPCQFDTSFSHLDTHFYEPFFKSDGVLVSRRSEFLTLSDLAAIQSWDGVCASNLVYISFGQIVPLAIVVQKVAIDISIHFYEMMHSTCQYTLAWLWLGFI